MATGLCSSIFALIIFAFLPLYVCARDDCLAYTDNWGRYHEKQKCTLSFCCGDCMNRYCCFTGSSKLTEDEQEDNCFSIRYEPSVVIIVVAVLVTIIALLVFICCCVCPCCCLYKLCRKPRPVVATTHTTVITSTPGAYPQQATMPAPSQPYQGAPYPYQVQPGYAPQPAMPSMPAMPPHGQPFSAGPPPSYQEATTAPVYPPQSMPYSQAAFSPGQHQPYPLQPPTKTNPSAPPPPTQQDYLSQPAYNPHYAGPSPNIGSG